MLDIIASRKSLANGRLDVIIQAQDSEQAAIHWLQQFLTQGIPNPESMPPTEIHFDLPGYIILHQQLYASSDMVSVSYCKPLLVMLSDEHVATPDISIVLSFVVHVTDQSAPLYVPLEHVVVSGSKAAHSVAAYIVSNLANIIITVITVICVIFILVPSFLCFYTKIPPNMINQVVGGSKLYTIKIARLIQYIHRPPTRTAVVGWGYFMSARGHIVYRV